MKTYVQKKSVNCISQCNLAISKIWKIKKIKLLAFAILFATCAKAQVPPQSVIDTIQSYIDTCRVSQNVTGALLKIEKVNNWSHTWVSGVVDTTTNTPLTGDEKFRVGSISKTFLATCVLKLADQNTLSLDDTIGKWLPASLVSIIPYGSSITIRRLLNHTSGMADAVDDTNSTLFTRFFENPFQQFNFDSIMFNDFTLLNPTNPPDDTLANYTNTGYWLLGKIVESATGMGYDQYITQNIITPLGLTNTYIPSFSDSSISLPYVHGYDLNPITSLITDFSYQNISLPYSAGSIISNVSDLIVFFKNLRDGNIIPMNWVDSMQNCYGHNPSSSNMYYGYGTIRVLNTSNGIDWIGHTGGISGYVTYMFYMPVIDSYITCNFSMEASNPTGLYYKIMKYLQSIQAGIISTSINNESLKIYPNPANNYIEITGLNNGTIEIINAQGQRVKTFDTSNTKITIDISKLAGGVYTIRIKTDNEIIVKKLIKQ
jgi:D-alanyl-D-alanine carboxypeptidase